MTTPMSEDGGPLKEWAPLAMLLQKIPVKVQSGIFAQEINFTCIDVVPEFIAVGTNHGIVYWYDRQTGELQRLQCENINSSITCLRVISTVDYMVAAGNNLGMVTVFQIPKQPPDSIPSSLKPKKKKEVERYNIVGLHKHKVTAVEWSKNGMKLFSGDETGVVVFTEMDFYMNLSKSFELLNEKYPVVQLSYQNGLLLISTTFRTIIVDRNEDNKVSQIGQKERKTLGKLGAVFANKQSQAQEPLIYASRSGLRLWEANKDGTVAKTLVFKDAIKMHQQEVELLNPAPPNTKRSRGEPSFGVVLPFFEDLLVTYCDDIIYVVNPTTVSITSLVTDLRRVNDVACTKDEIFVLEGERNIVRLAYTPESCTFVSGIEPTLEHPLASISKPVKNGLLELTSKLKESAIVPAIPFKINPTDLLQSISSFSLVSINTDTTSIINAEEALEIPPIVPIELTTSLVTEIEGHSPDLDTCRIPLEEDLTKLDRRKIFEKIGEQEFEDVLFSPGRKSNKKEKKISNGIPIERQESWKKVEGCFSLKSQRDLETIQKDVEDKEKLLAGVLNFDLSEYMTSSRVQEVANELEEKIEQENEVEEDFQIQKECCTESESIGDDDESYKTEIDKLREMGECSKQLLLSRKDEYFLGDNNNVDIGIEPFVDKVSEAQFNVLSKEFVSSANFDDGASISENEDWIFLDLE